jgi:hypothetical protein
MEDLQNAPTRTPELFPLEADVRNDSITFIRLTRNDYAQASFLDARILTPQTIARAMRWPQVADSIEAARLEERCGFIFHIGHVGSTLLSRLIGAHPRIFALREPMILRTFAQIGSEPRAQPQAWRDSQLEARLSGVLKLLSRSFDDRQLAVIKATSFVSELAADLMSRAAAPKAVMMYVAPESYIATILGGPNSRQEAKILTPNRLLRLHRRIGRAIWRETDLSEGEALALAWACEMSALTQAADAAAARVLPIDFDKFLLDPSILQRVFQHFDIEATAGEVRALVEGPIMSRYSKAPEYAYDRPLRLAVLSEARANHGAEIKRGLAWLDRAAKQFAVVRQAVLFAA